MLKTYKYRIYPTKEQSENIDSQMFHCGMLYNKMLKQRQDLYKNKWVSIWYNSQQNQLPLIKDNKEVYKNIHSQVLQKTIRRLDTSFKNFFRRIKKWEKPWFPRFQKPSRYNTLEYPQTWFSFVYKKEDKGVKQENIKQDKTPKKIKISKLWEVKIKQHRDLPEHAKIKTLSVTKNLTGKYFVTLVVETEDKIVVHPKKDNQVWIDLWINYLLTLSNWEQIDNPKHIKKAERKLEKSQKSLSRKKKWSKNRNKQRLILAKNHEKLTNSRTDHLHKITKNLTDNYGLIVLEDLNIKWMVKNHNLAKSISDASWGRLLTLLQYKAESAGSVIELVDPKYTSQDCYNCGKRVKKTLATRIHKCTCWYKEDRDINASKNILKKGLNQLQEVKIKS